MKYDPLIYGKSDLERIVNIEIDNDVAELFIEHLDGTIESKFVPNLFWILSNKKEAKDWIKLQGDLFYQWGFQYDNKEQYMNSKRSLKKTNIYAISNDKEALMVKDGYTYFKGMKQNEVSLLSFDIETTSLEHDSSAKLLLISNTYRNINGLERKLFAYTDYENEGAMLEDWCNWVREKNPSLLIGHNILMYDLPYMQFIAERYGVELVLGRNDTPIRFNTYESKFRKDASQFYHYKKVHIYGREIIDTMFLSIKYDIGRKYESYGLKNIIAQEGLEVENRQHYDASQIRNNYKNPVEWEKIKQYALHDADDALSLYDLMSPSIFYFTQSIPKPYQLMIESATGSQLNSLLIRSYLQKGHSVPSASMEQKYEGAISFGLPGIYHNVLKIDFSSLYPSIIRQYKVYDKYKDPEGNFLKMVEYFTNERLNNKKLAKETNNQYYKDMEQTQKIGINSAYGLMGAGGLNFNSPRNAAFITKTGRDLLKKTIKLVTGQEYTDWISNDE